MDAEDFLFDSLSTLYDYTPITHSSVGSMFTYSNGDTEITLHTPNTKPENWSLHASSIWESSLYLANNIHLLRLGERGGEGAALRVLELGAGAGCPGILIAKLYHQRVHVILSDYPDDELIASLKWNVERNTVGSSHTRVVPYIWGSKDIRDLLGEGGKGFDVVIAADPLWNVDPHALFLDSLEMVLAKEQGEARVHLVAGLHTGRYTIQAFLGLISVRSVFEVEELSERRVKEDSSEGLVREWRVERDGEDEKDRRNWVIWIVLKWKTVQN